MLRAAALLIAIFAWLGCLVVDKGVPATATVALALRVAAVVGTILNVVNWDRVAMRDRKAYVVKVLMNYLIPFCVSLTSAMLH